MAPAQGFTTDRSFVQLKQADVPNWGAQMILGNWANDPPIQPQPPAGSTAKLQNLQLYSKFRTWYCVRHRPTGELKFLQHIDWAADYLIQKQIGGVQLVPVRQRIRMIEANGNGTPQPVLGGPVPAEVMQLLYVPGR